jgi:hypothetical protein
VIEARGAHSLPYCYAGDYRFGKLSRCVFQILALHAVRGVTGFRELADTFDGNAVSMGRLSSHGLGPEWDTPCAEFDAKLEESVREDDLVALSLEHGLAPEVLALAIRSAEGLRRLQELREGSLVGHARARLAFETLVRIEGLVRLDGGVMLPFRARARLLALPGPLGERLAALDLERTIRFVATLDGPVSCDEILLFGASLAASASAGTAVQELWQPLYELSIAWSREVALWNAAQVEGSARQTQAFIDRISSVQDFLVRPENLAITSLRGGKNVGQDLELRDADRERLKHYLWIKPAIARRPR